MKVDGTLYTTSPALLHQVFDRSAVTSRPGTPLQLDLQGQSDLNKSAVAYRTAKARAQVANHYIAIVHLVQVTIY